MFGKALSVILVLGVIGLGLWLFMDNKQKASAPPPQAAATKPVDAPPPVASAEVVETHTTVPQLAGQTAYEPKTFEVKVDAPDGSKTIPLTKKVPLIEIELSEYAGYAGIIAANNGMAPNTDSIFYKKYGFVVKLTVSEEESWSALNQGKMAASATTADVLAVYGKQFGVVVPMQIGFSRGADGIDVRTEIKKINDLKGKRLATSQFTEADFLIRYLSQEAGVGINMLSDMNAQDDADKINLIYCEDAFKAGDLFLRHVLDGSDKIAGCVTWSPKTEEIVEQSKGAAKTLVTNRNLLVVADILIVNKGFADNNPKIVNGLTDGIIEGNKLVRSTPAAYGDLIEKAFKWDKGQAVTELKKVHLSNLPENLAFFGGDIDTAASFSGIYNSAVLAYSGVVTDPAPFERFLRIDELKKLEKDGTYADQVIEIKPIKLAGNGAVENNPILSKDIRFYFEPNKAELDMAQGDNTKNLESIKKLLQVSPGSTILLRGHTDDAKVEEFKSKGDMFYQAMRQKAIAFSDKRAKAVQQYLTSELKLDPTRIESVGRGWEEPVQSTAGMTNEADRAAASDKNRRVEVQWFTIE